VSTLITLSIQTEKEHDPKVTPFMTQLSKKVVFAPALVFITIVMAFYCFSSRHEAPQMGKSNLPLGQVTPAVRLGPRHGIILASDGSLWAWGENAPGEPVLGLGSSNRQVGLRRIGHETNWSSIAVGNSHCLGIKSDGTLWAWGGNGDFQLGDGTVLPRNTPVPSAPGDHWKQAAAGLTYSVALKKDGTLWSWGGANWAGQLGIGSTNNSPVPVQIGSSSNWTRIWANNVETAGLQSDGSLWIWGANLSSSEKIRPVLSPTRVSSDTNWVDLCFGYFITLAIKSDGTLWAWGRDAYLYTGARNNSLDAIPARVGNESDWQACSSSGGFGYALLKKDGSLWILDATDQNTSKPPSEYKPVQFRRVQLQKDFVAFAMRSYTGAAVTRDGEVWTWGFAFGEYTPANRPLQSLVRLLNRFSYEVDWGNPKPILKPEPWQLHNLDSNESTGR
jgi:alpha-tubulin suppressor-like RCC1 family protein